VGVVVCGVSEPNTPDTDIAPTCMFALLSAWLRLSSVVADTTDCKFSGVEVTVVSTAMVCASRRRRS
jgi:hypothetical protein